MTAEPSRVAARIPETPSSRVECTLDNDLRLVAGVGAIVAHAARRAQLSEKTQEDVAAAAVDTSSDLLLAARGNGTAATTMKVLLEEFRDRIEMTIESPAGTPTEEIHKRLSVQVAECARCERSEGRVRVTLLKACGDTKSKPGA